MVAMHAKWVHSEGGPLLLLPLELAVSWRGVETGDYERACEVDDYVGWISVGDGTGMLLGEEPHSTTWRQQTGGGDLVRWVFADDEAHIWSGLETDDSLFRREPEAFLVRESGTCLLFDSALAGDEAFDEQLEIHLLPGRYAVESARLTLGENTQVGPQAT